MSHSYTRAHSIVSDLLEGVPFQLHTDYQPISDAIYDILATSNADEIAFPVDLLDGEYDFESERSLLDSIALQEQIDAALQRQTQEVEEERRRAELEQQQAKALQQEQTRQAEDDAELEGLRLEASQSSQPAIPTRTMNNAPSIPPPVIPPKPVLHSSLHSSGEILQPRLAGTKPPSFPSSTQNGNSSSNNNSCAKPTAAAMPLSQIAEFLATESSPFDSLSLKSINDLEELRTVLLEADRGVVLNGTGATAAAPQPL